MEFSQLVEALAIYYLKTIHKMEKRKVYSSDTKLHKSNENVFAKVMAA